MDFKTKLRNFKDCAVNSMIYKAYYDDGLDDNLVYFESRDGLDFTGNIFRIVEELSTGKYGNFKIHVHAKPQVVDKIKAFQKNYNLKIDKIITKEAIATKTLEKAKYIFTDSGIRPKYVKREGQIFVNTWHGTPLKLMGKYNIPEEHRLGNVQHPFLSSDYLLYPNDYMMEKMLDSYMIEKIYPGEILLEGYPRNSVFFNESRRKELKNELGLSGKDIFIYMPTFRGILMERNEEGQKDDVENYLSRIDDSLTDDQVLFAKLHVLNASRIDFSKFNHVMPFPEDYELYDVINLADVLVTDYSSVFFDFANTRRKIILFNYDEKDYESYRGFYFPLEDLPFPKVQDIDDLIRELNFPKDYDDEEFIGKFCTYDNADAVENICRRLFKGEDSCKFETISNDNPNILIYAGDLSDNEKTSRMLDFLNGMDRRKFNFFITYKQWDENILEHHEEVFRNLPSDVEVLPMRFNLLPTIREKFKYNKYLSNRNPSQLVDRLLKRSFIRQYSDFKFDLLLDFDGHDDYLSLVFSNVIKENKNDFEEFKKSNGIIV
ncbi:MAG: CDP-glycerol glycerophosphotransferase family protein [Methanobrevibacter sp.]|nr:CDP-glycerol glycerophosphotransferase family protein [Methanobrevibacter sp.]